ncbi:hypothetical protein GMSM_24130 [Geomonas sp. Red276]
MFLRKYLSTLRGTYLFMVCFGLLMGVIFPFYSWLFFGTRAFSPLYAFGCVAAGLTVGTFCYRVIREALKMYVERQLSVLQAITGEGINLTAGGGDELQQLMECNEALMNKVLVMVDNVSRLTADISQRHGRLTGEFSAMVSSNEGQARRGKQSLEAVGQMNDFFTEVIREIEEIAARTAQRASISTEMSSATDEIDRNVQEYSALLLDTSNAIDRMARSIRETTANARDLNDSTEQTYHSIIAISDSLVEVRDRTQRTSASSEKVMREAEQGMGSMTATIATMREIEGKSDQLVDAITRLSQHTSRVGAFLDVIKEVVAQTALLSLNASIIAAQAGEQGRAFAVVAEEVRGLAKRTASSTEEIEELVKNIQQETVAAEEAARQGKEKVSQGVRVSESASAALERIKESADEASSMVQEIARATEQQASGSRVIIEEAEKNLERMKRMTAAVTGEEHEARMIVKSLEQMRGSAKRIANSTEEQARGNRLYMKSVQDDNDKVRMLNGTCVEQITRGDRLRNDINEVGRLMEVNAQEARRIMGEIEQINRTLGAIQSEMAVFRPALPSPE